MIKNRKQYQFMKIRQSPILVLFMAICVSLNSCAIWGPSYKEPNVEVPASWASPDALALTDKNNKTATQLANMRWWEQFNDPVLNKLVVYALEHNPTIQQQIGSIIQAQGNLQAVQMAWVPAINFIPGFKTSGTYTGSSNSSVGQYTMGSNVGYFVDFMPTYSLNIMQQLRQQEAAKASLAVAKYQKDAMRITIIGQVVGSYLSLRGYDYGLRQQQQLAEDTALQYSIGQQQYKEGYISLLLLQDYQSQYEAAKAQVPITQNNIVATTNAIRVLADKNPGDLARGVDFTNIPTDGLIPVNLPATVLKNRPDIRQMESGLVQANANIGVATTQFFPAINLTGNTGFASTGLNTLFNAGSDFWQSQVSAAMPALNLSIFGQIKGAKGLYYQAYWNYINTVRAAFSQVDNALSAHAKLTQSYKDQQEVYGATLRAYNLEHARYKNGLDSLMPVLQYKIKMEQAALALAGAKTQQLQTITILYQAMAAGFNVNNTDETSIKFGDRRDI